MLGGYFLSKTRRYETLSALLETAYLARTDLAVRRNLNSSARVLQLSA